MKKIFIYSIISLLSLAVFAQGKLDRSKRPQPGPAPVISLADPITYKLNNGMTILVVENHKLPKVAATLMIDAGPISEGSKAGVVTIMGQMLGEGTTSMSKSQFD